MDDGCNGELLVVGVLGQILGAGPIYRNELYDVLTVGAFRILSLVERGRRS